MENTAHVWALPNDVQYAHVQDDELECNTSIPREEIPTQVPKGPFVDNMIEMFHPVAVSILCLQGSALQRSIS